MSIQQLMLGIGAKDKTYLDDVFSTFLYKGTNAYPLNIVNGINLTEHGGAVFGKARSGLYNWSVHDTEQGVQKGLAFNGTQGQYDNTGNQGGSTTRDLTNFNNNGFTLGTAWSASGINPSGVDVVTYTLRKCPGFFDVVTWTGNATAGRQISHNLKCAPGLIIVKKTSGTDDWTVGHSKINDGQDDWDYGLKINSTQAKFDDDNLWNDTTPSSTHITLGGSGLTNENAEDYIAYVFAGGASTAATARSVDFDGTGDYLTTSTSSDYDLGTGDFTLECWIKWDATASNLIFLEHRTSSDQNDLVLYVDNDAIIFNSWSADRITTGAISNNQWYHVALVRNSATTTMYVNGISQGTYADTRDYDNEQMRIGVDNTGSYDFDGKISNVRLVKGTAVYTSSFKPPTKPLTSITNTKLLCCQSSTVTTATVGTVTSSGDPTASTDSPFDDPAGFKFGESGKENIIKCGSYTGNGSSTGPEIFLGFEPQWIMLKRTNSSSYNWHVYDNMRGMPSNEYDHTLRVNTNGAEYSTMNAVDVSATGFQLRDSTDAINSVNDTYVYVAIRRPDSLVQKPAEVGTDVFAMDTGAGGTTIPNYDTGFPVDMAIDKKPASSTQWYLSGRLTGTKYLRPDQDITELTQANYTWDSNVGWGDGSWQASDYQSWMWKRHAGFDMLNYNIISASGQITIPHSLGKVPEMIWQKHRTTDDSWIVYHKDLTANHWMLLDGNNAETDGGTGYWGTSSPTSSHFEIKGSSRYTGNHLFMLFSSVAGISKVGSYDGSDSAQTITTGFQPRFVIIKNYGEQSSWYVLDTTRGWASGNDQFLVLNTDAAQTGTVDFGAPTSTGFTLTGLNSEFNQSGRSYIYYAHA